MLTILNLIQPLNFTFFYWIFFLSFENTRNKNEELKSLYFDPQKIARET